MVPWCRDMPRGEGTMASVGATALAAVAAALAAGLAEGVLYVGRSLATVVGAGFAALYAAPLGFTLALLVQWLWRAWRPAWQVSSDADDADDADDDAAAAATAEAGARVAGALGFALLAVAALGGAGWLGASVGAALTKSTALAALAAGGIVAASAALVLACARPVAAVIANAARALERRGTPRTTALLSPHRVLAGAAALVVTGCAAIWLVVIGPATAQIDYGFGGYLIVYVVVFAVTRAGWPRLRQRRLRVGLALVIGVHALAVAGLTGYSRRAQPVALLSAWGAMPVGGLATEFTIDVARLRRRLTLPGLAPAEREGAHHPDVVLVTIDTVRADRTPLHGGPALMPNLATFAAGAAVFDWAFAPSNATRRSLPAIVTGLDAARIRGRVIGWALKVDPRHVLLAERFAAAGYTTAGFFCCSQFFGGKEQVGLDRGLAEVGYKRDAKGLNRLALRFLEREKSGRPRFLWLHYYEPHPWDRTYPPTTPDDDPRPRYDRTLADIDRSLGPLFAALGDTGRETIIAVTSDHGEGLGEHGALHHNTDLFNSQLHVPLIVRGPGIPARRMPAPVSLVELAPALLDLAGFEPPAPPTMDGGSLAAALRAATPPAFETGVASAVMVADRSVPHGGRALVVGRHKLIVIEGKPPALFDYLADPGELTNLAPTQPDLVRELRARMDPLATGRPPF